MNYRIIKRKLDLIQKEVEIQDIPRIITFTKSTEQNNVWIIVEQYYNKNNIGTRKEIYTEDYQQIIDKYEGHIHRVFYDSKNKPILMINSLK